jgi:hypothetical protein
MLDEDKALFSFRSTLDDSIWINEGTSYRYSAIALLGIMEAIGRGLECQVDIERVAEELHAEYRYANNLGDIGLALWVAAKGIRHGLPPERARELLGYILDLLERDQARETRIVDSMEYAWTLLGLLECRAEGVEHAKLEKYLSNTYLDLSLNFHQETSLFSFNRREQRGEKPRCKRLSFFAEQVYGILAFARYYELTGDAEALKAAEACAEKIISHQTSHGGWAWRYHALKGTMAEIFPLYSVHQDGMAPMALAKLSVLSSKDYLPAVAKGILWLRGDNELGESLYDEQNDIIWRSVLRKGPLKVISQMNKALSLIDQVNIHIPEMTPFYKVKREVRSYHMGWILYADAALLEATRGTSNSAGRDIHENEPA